MRRFCLTSHHFLAYRLFDGVSDRLKGAAAARMGGAERSILLRTLQVMAQIRLMEPAATDCYHEKFGGV